MTIQPGQATYHLNRASALVETRAASTKLERLEQVRENREAYTRDAFAEWMAITYGDRGIKVTCLCAQGVNTEEAQTGSTQPSHSIPDMSIETNQPMSGGRTQHTSTLLPDETIHPNWLPMPAALAITATSCSPR